MAEDQTDQRSMLELQQRFREQILYALKDAIDGDLDGWTINKIWETHNEMMMRENSSND